MVFLQNLRPSEPHESKLNPLPRCRQVFCDEVREMGIGGQKAHVRCEAIVERLVYEHQTFLLEKYDDFQSE
jgi:hypothetical protein